MLVKIQKKLCGGRNTDNLINSMCFYQNLMDSTFLSKILLSPHVFLNSVRSKCFVMTIIQHLYSLVCEDTRVLTM